MSLIVKGLKKSYGKKTVLENINLNITKGVSIGLLGPNGAGKTTLVRCCTGLSKFKSGEVIIGSNSISSHFIDYISEISIIFDKSHFYENLTGYQNLLMCYDLKGVEKSGLDDIVEVVGMTNRIHEKVSKYSFGMKKRLQVAMSLIGNPSYIFLDEPFNGLDLNATNAFVKLFKTIKDRGVSLIISTHNISVLDELVDELFILFNGSIIGQVKGRDIHDQIVKIELESTTKVNYDSELDPKFTLIDMTDEKIVLRCDGDTSIYKSSFLEKVKKYVRKITIEKYIEFYYSSLLGGDNCEQIV